MRDIEDYGEWFGYECYSPDCPESFQNGGSGCVLDVRRSFSGLKEPSVNCPICDEIMDFKGRWPASESGH